MPLASRGRTLINLQLTPPGNSPGNECVSQQCGNKALLLLFARVTCRLAVASAGPARAAVHHHESTFHTFRAIKPLRLAALPPFHLCRLFL